MNNATLRIVFEAKNEKSVDVKSEIAYAMSFARGFLCDGGEYKIKLDNIAVEIVKADGTKVMHAISSLAALECIASGEPIEWLSKTIFQDYTEDFVQSVAKRKVSDLEKGMREVIAKVLFDKHGARWWLMSVSNTVRQSTERMYESQEGIATTDGGELIHFTFLLDLRKIVVSNWGDFVHIFKSQARFTQLLDDLNVIRRAEAHNREITQQQLIALTAIHKELMDQIAAHMPSAVSYYLVENWRIQLGSIFESNIEEHANIASEPCGIVEAMHAVEGQIRRFIDLEVRVRSLLVPPGKEVLNNRLVMLLGNVRESLEQMLSAAQAGDADRVVSLQSQNERANQELSQFREEYLMSELGT
ncbi:hypothetical protein [Rosistilla oblonga]|uniref:hypothetical protein n=1 Tax=Rosistilla oblonga TaxID=2527990 RepID=UPI003A96DBE3